MIVDRTAYVISLIQVLSGAVFLVILLPLYVWRNYLKNKSYTYRFVFVTLVQNFFLINLVLFLGFLNICNRFTVVLGMIIFFVFINWYFSDRQFLHRCRKCFDGLIKMLYGKKHFFTLQQEIKCWFLKSWQNIMAWPLWQHIRQNLSEYLFLSGIVIYNVWFLSYNILEFHSYQFSDIPVHQAWIHALGKGTLFVDGVYPFGMHAIVYLIHKLFFIDLREVLLYFGIFQTVLLMLSIHFLAKSIFRWKFGAFMSTICFSLLLNQGRYAAALPQECGVFALVLAGWCLVRFFRTPLEKHTIEGDSRIRRFFRIKQYLNKQYLNADLILFMLAVSLTIAYHFYTAIATCMLVLSFFGAYFFQTVKKQYWVPLVTAGILGVVLAVAPLMACYARGIPFQESMEWAMSVIRGEEWEGSEPEYQEQLEKFRSESNQGGRDYEIKPGEMSEIRTDIKNKSFSEKLFFYYNSVYGFFRAIISNDKLIDIFVICFALATVFSGSLFLFRKTRPEGSGYFAIVLYVIVIGIMGSAQALGIVKIFEFYRAMTFIEPFLGIIYTIPLDFIFRFLDSYKNRIYQRLLAFVSIILCTGLVYVIFQQGWVHDFFDVNLAYYNEPDYLVKHIRKTYKPRTFTIVSPVEEYYQVIDYGYHENISKFVNMVSGNEKEYKIPTQYVFFFIEKRILDDYYYGSVDVSPEYAQKDFIYFASAQDYYFQRAILESKAYYWALEFQKMYPNSFKVYFENDIYIAYILEQNPFSLYNLQIDYLPKGENE